MYAVRLVIPDGFGPGRPQVVHETRKYTDEAEATAIRDAWRLNLVERSCNGLLAVRDSPGWLRLELVDYTDTPEDSAMPDGWVMDVHLIWQRFTPDTEPDPWLHITESVVHEVKPGWCDECDAYHVECEFGCCAIEV